MAALIMARTKRHHGPPSRHGPHGGAVCRAISYLAPLLYKRWRIAREHRQANQLQLPTLLFSPTLPMQYGLYIGTDNMMTCTHIQPRVLGFLSPYVCCASP